MENEKLEWGTAYKWTELVNEAKDVQEEPVWNFDCNFKLDFDGPLLRVASRFYPPNYHIDGSWKGEYKVLLIDEVIIKKEFDCQTLDELKTEVEKFNKHYINIIRSRLKF